MSDSILVMASDGLLEFDESDIQDVSLHDRDAERGVEVLLKTGLGFLLVGQEAAQFLARVAGKLVPGR